MTPGWRGHEALPGDRDAPWTPVTLQGHRLSDATVPWYTASWCLNGGHSFGRKAPLLLVELCPPKRYADILTPGTCGRETLSGNRVSADVIKLGSGHTVVGRP